MDNGWSDYSAIQPVFNLMSKAKEGKDLKSDFHPGVSDDFSND